MTTLGRPTKLVGGTADLIVTLIEGGIPREHAAKAAGIAKGTLYRWLAQGEKETDVDPGQHSLRELRAIATERELDPKGVRTKAKLADLINDNPSAFRDFRDRLRAADSRFMASAMAQMREVGSEDWRMWQQMLLMRFPELRTNLDAEELGADPETGGTEDEAQLKLDRATTIRIKMLGTGTDG